MVKRRRNKSAKVVSRNLEIVAIICRVKSEHPFWGYRRVWAYLKYVEGLMINQKRVYRLLKELRLTVTTETRLKAKRANYQSKPRPTGANEWWGIDMTKVMTDEGWAYIVIVLDWYTKKIVGHYVGAQAKSWQWLVALNIAVNRQFPEGIREQAKALNLMSDNGSQPTSLSFMRASRELKIHQAFTAYNNPKGNADTERMMRTLKEESLWLREWHSVEEVKRAMDKFVEQFNANYLHSTLGYKTPNHFEQEYFESERTTLNLAA